MKVHIQQSIIDEEHVVEVAGPYLFVKADHGKSQLQISTDERGRLVLSINKVRGARGLQVIESHTNSSQIRLVVQTE